MADTLKTIKENTKKLLKMGADELMDEIHFYRESEKVEKQAFKPDANGYSPGDTVSIKRPTNWIVQEDNFDITSAIQDAKETSVDLVLDMSATVPFDLDTTQLATEIDLGKTYERLIQPAIYDLAANIESRFIQKAAQNTPNIVGTPGSTVVDMDTVMSGGELMDEYLAPGQQRKFLMDSAAMRSAVNANKGLFTSTRKERNQAYIGTDAGFDWFKNQLIYRHTNGNDVTGLAMDGSTAEGATTIVIDGLTNTTGTFTKGTTFTIAGVNAVHPQTKTNLGFLKSFTHIGDDQTANGSGEVTLTLSEPLYASTSDSRQNITALPANDATVTVTSGDASTTYKHSLQFHKKAFRTCSVPLAMPKNAELAEQVSEQGINIALIKDFDVLTRKWVTRLDFLGGLVPVRPYHACRVTN